MKRLSTLLFVLLTISLSVVAQVTTSGIVEITKSIFIEDDGAIYNLSGQRVDGKNLKKGIYIRKNKKMIVK